MASMAERSSRRGKSPGAGQKYKVKASQQYHSRSRRQGQEEPGPGTAVGTWSDFGGAIDQSQTGWAYHDGNAGMGCDVQLDTTVRYSKAMNRLGIAESF